MSDTEYNPDVEPRVDAEYDPTRANEYRSEDNDPVPVVADEDISGVDPNTADSDRELARDDAEAIDESNIIDSRTRGAKPVHSYREPGDEEGLPGPEDGTSIKRIHRWTKTVHTNVNCAVTKTKTVAKAKYTKCTYRTTTACATTTHKVTPTVTSIVTVYTSTTRPTRRVTSTFWTTIFSDTTLTTTITPARRTIPTPAGFVAVADDPDNDPRKFPPIQKRDAAPEPAPVPEPEPEPEPVPGVHGPKKYPTAIGCTRTYQTKTATHYVWRTVTKASSIIYKTEWKTVHKAPVHRYLTLGSTRTVRRTISTVRTIPTTISTTVTSTTTAYVSTSIIRLPQETFYAACGNRNRAPPPDERDVWTAGYADPDFTDQPFVQFNTNATDYECCVACQTYSGPNGPCVGSLYRYLGLWGDVCAIPPDPDCDPVSPPDRGSCNLILAGNAAGKCRRHRFEIWSWQDPPRYLSNGPGCARWKRRNSQQPLF
ncbi:hypothetical protein Dda_5878 [Drechslerella dactyloides]|uniref:Uncharacterized protein n=1 Tax=Drechslerella dactyloides TaxID=74499 RepID=A0AAD6NJF2_DREDA|nr:hypothetical protein Dda_5878 [Drechslerella dactyloides]